ncbi:MFS transporter permease [Alkalimonas collagenimarina]|uniref:MFS transporter permease n=1 Tax=Alkalimonas collagenimarina TaxID=400390 RepID=A0ABT9GUX0_9GAMM|nr:MFS transporter permease [Alkalimonas collagenimarina]MDP4534773.1 MFS transporter permease [Alkalimonas collagenimarina]
MNGGASYQLQDFIPFTIEIYVRLLERLNETLWPLHLITLTLGMAVVWLALTNRTRLACLFIAPIWTFVAVAFFMQHYAELNWAGGYIGYVFFAQAMLLLVISLSGKGIHTMPQQKPAVFLGGVDKVAVLIGIAIALAGLIALPLLAPLTTGASWQQAEVFGIHADPTAITTLGLLLIMLRGWVLWLSMIIPACWLLISALTLWALDASGAIALIAIQATGLIGLMAASAPKRKYFIKS